MYLSSAAVIVSIGFGLAGDPGPAQRELEQRAGAIRPTADELRWQQIPWLASLVQARALAQQEKRPIFVWAVDDDPFERC